MQTMNKNGLVKKVHSLSEISMLHYGWHMSLFVVVCLALTLYGQAPDLHRAVDTCMRKYFLLFKQFWQFNYSGH